MDSATLAALADAGKTLGATKLYITCLNCMWVYEYLLTFADEIRFGWSGRKSWVFVLFLANRYIPVMHLIWVNNVMFGPSKSVSPLCERTKWIAMLHTVAVIFFAQSAVTLRIYAVTKRNKWLSGGLSVVLFTQFCYGIYFIVVAAHGPLADLPQIDLDPFKVCFFARWKVQMFVYNSLGITFDVIAFVLILVTAKKTGKVRYPGIPSILDTILQDATLYFVFMFACQVNLEMFLIFAPEKIQLLPGIATTIILPIMATRLMLSLKKAAAEPRGPWAVTTMTTNFSRPPGNDTVRFASSTTDTSRADTLTLPDVEDLELESIPELPQNRGSQQLC